MFSRLSSGVGEVLPSFFGLPLPLPRPLATGGANPPALSVEAPACQKQSTATSTSTSTGDSGIATDEDHHHHFSHAATPSDLRTAPLLSCHASALAMHMNIWVRRPGASATRVTVQDDDLVDNVRDVILQKYANSLGRSIDSPDITLKICSREQANKNVSNERVLGPEESIGQTLDTYYPGGQTIEEALLIEIPQRRTPRPSPRFGNHQIPYYIAEEVRPGESAREYFPPMPAVHSPGVPSQLSHTSSGHHPAVHSMAVLSTGQLPPLPSPGAHGSRRHGRPKYGRQHTSSPTILHTSQPNGHPIEAKQQLNGVQAPLVSPLPTPPLQAAAEHKPSVAPSDRTSSPHPGQHNKRNKKVSPAGLPSQSNTPRSVNGDRQPRPKPASAGLLDGTVPPINVLIVEDNVINLRLLEAFMKRLKVRWKTAMDGKQAVAQWRTGGFHLVLMDIQLPVMNGLEATKEIRRLEGVNGIGVFSGSPVTGVPKSPTNEANPLNESDALPDLALFKSPVIIVALTASSLQSDRHEALAAGCNDFLTKPVNFVWMERKVTEWGCMQALIDYDGWRKWKDYANANKQSPQTEKEIKDEKARTKAELKAMFSRAPPTLKERELEGSSEPASTPAVVTRAAATATTIHAGQSNSTTATAKKAPNLARSSTHKGRSNLGITQEVDEG